MAITTQEMGNYSGNSSEVDFVFEKVAHLQFLNRSIEPAR